MTHSYTPYPAALMYYASKIPSHLREDFVQKAALYLLEQSHKYDPLKASFNTWSKWCIIGLASDFWRAFKKDLVLSPDDYYDWGDSCDQNVDSHELLDIKNDISLTSYKIEIMNLYKEGWNATEIAAKFKVSRQAISENIQQVIKEYKKELKC